MSDSTTEGVEALVPARLEGVTPSNGWRKTITGLNPREQGGRMIEGEFLDAGASVRLPAGTLVISVDKKITDWAVHYKTGEQYAVTDAAVTVWIADGSWTEGLRPLWDRHFKQSSSAFGTTTVKKLTTLLASHPPVGGTAEVLAEARRPNFQPGTCRWCDRNVPKNQGQLVGHGETIQVECHPACMVRPAVSGEPCTLCGVTVVAGQAEQVMMRDVMGPRWQTQHRPPRPGRTCLEVPVASFEQQQADLEAHRAIVASQREREAAKQAKNAERRAASAAKKKGAFEAEQARVSGLTEVRRDTEVLFRKNLGTGRGHAEFRKHTVHLSDGTTTMRWSAVWPEGRVEDARESYARAAYSDLKWEPDTAQTPAPRLITPPAAGATTARACPPGEHCDNCGSAEPEYGSGWMSASLGTACGIDCFDAMADAQGRHARRYHR